MKRSWTVGVWRLAAWLEVLATALSIGCAQVPTYGLDSPTMTVAVPAPQLSWAPLVPRSALRVGLFLAPDAHSSALVAGGGDVPRYRFALGDAFVALVDATLRPMFASAVPVDRLPTPGAPSRDVDLVVAAGITRQGDVAVPEIWIEVVEPDGTPVAGGRAKLGGLTWVDADSAHAPATLAGHAGNTIKAVFAQAIEALVLSSALAAQLDRHGAPWRWTVAPVASPIARRTVILRCVSLVACSVDPGVEPLALAMRKLDPSVELAGGAEFLDAMYPWLNDAPGVDEDQVAAVLATPAARGRAAAIGVRFLAAVTMSSPRSVRGSIVCGQVGCFGYEERRINEHANVQVFDFSTGQRRRAEELRREYATLAIPAVILPIPIPLAAPSPLHEEVARRLVPLLGSADER